MLFLAVWEDLEDSFHQVSQLHLRLHRLSGADILGVCPRRLGQPVPRHGVSRGARIDARFRRLYPHPRVGPR